jgi:hypothetical protein
MMNMQIALVAGSADMTTAYDLGLGKHLISIPLENFKPLNLRGLISVALDGAAQSWAKTSFAFTLLRISDGRLMTGILWFIIVSMNVFTGLGCLFFWINCTPVQKVWNPELDGSCWDYNIVLQYAKFSSGMSAARSRLCRLLSY